MVTSTWFSSLSVLTGLYLVMSSISGVRTATLSVHKAPEIDQNQLRFPYGTNFKFNGVLHYNLDRVLIVTQFPLPRIPSRSWNPVPQAVKEDFPSCENLKYKMEMKTAFMQTILRAAPGTAQYCPHCQKLAMELQGSCQRAATQHRVRKEQYKLAREKAHKLLEQELPAALPELYAQGPKQGVNSRPKRWLTQLIKTGAQILPGLITIGSEIVSHFVHKKRAKAIKKAVTHLRTSVAVQYGRLRQIDQDLLMTGAFQVNSTTAVIKQLNKTDSQMGRLWSHVEQINKNLNIMQLRQQKKLVDAYQAELMLERYTNEVTSILTRMDMRTVLYERLALSIEELLDALAILSTGHLPRTFITHSRLENMIEQVKETLEQMGSHYIPTVSAINDYYDMKLASYYVDTTRNTLIISFPIFINPNNKLPYRLWEIETAYVPIPDLNLTAHSYTRVQMEKPYIATSKDHYIQLQIPELRMCKVIHLVYYCEEIFLTKHKSQPTCASALFYESPSDKIKEACTFEYVFNRTVTPSVLDGGKHIVLANFPSQKTRNCITNNNLDSPLKIPDDPYVLVDRSVLCQCDLKSEYLTVLSSLSACTDQLHKKPHLEFTYNPAFLLYAEELSSILAREPEIPGLPEIPEFPPEFLDSNHDTPALLNFSMPDIKDPMSKERPDTMQQLAENLEEMIFHQAHMQDRHEDMMNDSPPDPIQWVDNWETHAIVFFISLLGICGLVLALYVCYKYKAFEIFSIGTLAALPTTNALKEGHGAEAIGCSHRAFLFSIVLLVVVMIVLLLKLIKPWTWWQGHKYKGVCKIYLMISCADTYMPLLIRKFAGQLPKFSQSDCPITKHDVKLHASTLQDYLTIDWSTLQAKYSQTPLTLPMHVPVRLIDRFRIRHLLKNPDIRFTYMIKQADAWHFPQIEQNNPIWNPNPNEWEEVAPPKPPRVFEEEITNDKVQLLYSEQPDDLKATYTTVRLNQNRPNTLPKTKRVRHATTLARDSSV